MSKLRDLFLNALESMGCGVISAITLWNESYYPEIKALKPGKYTYHIGRHEITFKKIAIKA